MHEAKPADVIKEVPVRIQIRGRHAEVTEAIKAHVRERFEKVAKQVSDLAQLDVELMEERNPAIADGKVAEATLYLKGVTLRAKEASPDLIHSIDLMAEKMARQVKRERDKRRRRREQASSRLAESA
jgi:putative sigma-54 modulation protein